MSRSDYPKDYPLKEVFVIAKHCSGGIILGFEQISITSAIKKRGCEDEQIINKDSIVSLPTPWNHLEAGILYGLKLPLLIFKEKGIEGGVFDYGITDAFVHSMPVISPSKEKIDELKHVLLKWYSLVSAKYSEY